MPPLRLALATLLLPGLALAAPAHDARGRGHSHRPPTAARPAPPARPAPAPRQAPPVRPAPRRPAPRVHVRPAPPRPVVVHRRPYVVRPWTGVFVYGPRPHHHGYYHGPSAPAEPPTEHLPTRKVDRNRTFALGLRTGSLVGAYRGADQDGLYGDFGLGATARYRPVEGLGIEVAATHHDATWSADTARSQTMGQASLVGFVSPWSRVSPYGLAGMTVTGTRLNDDVRFGGTWSTVTDHGVLWGPHAGIGLEFAIGPSLALDLDVRGVGYVNTGSSEVHPLALQTHAGMLFHF